ncbi:class I SAM-dependent RNA methyltransferase [Spirochaetota bacterium]
MDTPINSNKSLARRVKQHVIAGKHQFFAIVQPGFEVAVKKELPEIGIDAVSEIVEGGIEFSSKLEGCYRVNLCSRTITRLLMRLMKFKISRFNKMGRRVSKFPWELYLKAGSSVSFSIKCRHSKLYHTGRIGDEFIKAISARLDEYNSSVSFIEKADGENSQVIFIRMENDICQVSIDSTGRPLYKRGHNKKVTPATLRETLASLILFEAHVSSYDILIDGMCGSGTFSMEAAEIYAGRIPSGKRDFAFMNWPSFKPAAFNYLKNKLLEKENDQIPNRIIVNDVDKDALSVAGDNLKSTGLFNLFDIMSVDFLREEIPFPRDKKCLIVLNPPYGGRLQKKNIDKFYRQLGNIVRSKYRNCGYAIISPGLEYEKILSLRYDKKILFMNGGIKVAVIIKYAIK